MLPQHYFQWISCHSKLQNISTHSSLSFTPISTSSLYNVNPPHSTVILLHQLHNSHRWRPDRKDIVIIIVLHPHFSWSMHKLNTKYRPKCNLSNIISKRENCFTANSATYRSFRDDAIAFDFLTPKILVIKELNKIVEEFLIYKTDTYTEDKWIGSTCLILRRSGVSYKFIEI